MGSWHGAVTDTSGLIEDLGSRLRSSRSFWTALNAGMDLEKKRFYESPAVQRRRKSQAARRRNRTS